MATPGRLIEDDDGLRALLGRVRRIAVLGIKTESQRGQPAIVGQAAKAASALQQSWMRSKPCLNSFARTPASSLTS